MSTRVERDSIGEIEVPADHYWGAQTQRSIVHFAIGDDRMPLAVCHALALIKKAAAIVNARNGSLPQWKADLIVQVADEIVDGRPRRRVPAVPVPDRFGHAHQHERQRGHLEPGDRAARRRDGHARIRSTPTTTST